MKQHKLKSLFFISTIAFSVILFISCGSDETNAQHSSFTKFQGAKRVFGENLIKKYTRVSYISGGHNNTITSHYTYDENGYLTRIDENSYYIEIDYSEENHITLLKKESDGTSQWRFKIKVGNNGFAQMASLEEMRNKTYVNVENIEFFYNHDNQIERIKTNTPQNGLYEEIFTYSDGDITTREKYKDGTLRTKVTIVYEKDQVGKVDNVAKIMDYETFFDLDFDENNYLLFCGLLGNPTKHLPANIKWQSYSPAQDLIIQTICKEFDKNRRLLSAEQVYNKTYTIEKIIFNWVW